ncbi:MAG: hypothetical protein J6331_03170, partial [Lentisphaeria bacterium]|nr:hypothetical protein [Lentisphaeria bacterium]
MTKSPEEQYKELPHENNSPDPGSREETDLFAVLPREEEETFPKEEAGKEAPALVRELPETEKKEEEAPVAFKVMEEEYTEVPEPVTAGKLPEKPKKSAPLGEKNAENILPKKKKTEKIVNLAR